MNKNLENKVVGGVVVILGAIFTYNVFSLGKSIGNYDGFMEGCDVGKSIGEVDGYLKAVKAAMKNTNEGSE